MNLPAHLQQEVEKWATVQGVEPEQFIVQAVVDKLGQLQKTTQPQGFTEPRLYRKEGVLVVDAEWSEDLDVNQLIDDLREERIREQMSW